MRRRKAWECRALGRGLTQRTQYPSIKKDALNYRGLDIMIESIFLNYGVLGSLGSV